MIPVPFKTEEYQRKAVHGLAVARDTYVANLIKGATNSTTASALTQDAVKEAIDKAMNLEVKVACYEAGVVKDAVDDVVALARSYMAADEDLDLEDAIEKVVKKYPQFKKEAADPYEEEERKSWGQRQTGRGAKKLSWVERAFYDLNPDLKR